MLARRRTVAFAWLGLGALATSGVLKLLTGRYVVEFARGNSQAEALGGRLEELIIQAARVSFDQWLIVLAVGGAIALVVGAIGSAAQPVRR